MPDHASGQPLPEWVTWACCDQVHNDGTPCTGAAQVDYGRCLAHLDDTQVARVMTYRPNEAPPDLDARGVRLSRDDLGRVLASARSEDASPRLRRVLLDRATLVGGVSLRGATVEGRVSLDEATVIGGVSLGGATVEGGVSLFRATVEGGVFLGRATVEGGVSLGAATVKGGVSLGRATVKGGVSLFRATVEGGVFLDWATVEGGVFLDEATVEGGFSLDKATVEGQVFLDRATLIGNVSLGGATVEGGVSLGGATVEGRVSLDRSRTKGDLSLRGAAVKGHVSLDGARVEGEALLGPMSASMLSLEGTEFTRLVTLDVTAERVALLHVRFLAGLTARVNEAEVVMERVEMQGSAVLAGAAVGSVASTSPPRLLQLAGTNVASLTLTRVDLTACHFLGAINLDRLHIDGSPQLDIRRGWRAHRRVLDEENEWWDKYALWTDLTYNIFLYDALFDDCLLKYYAARADARKASLARERAHEIAGVYRALRKGREEGKDEPGAADFYYGEMEMRRKAAGGSVEGLLLTAYWLLSGYGLRAWRAFATLVALIAIATVLFATVGLARTSVTVYRPTRPGAGTSAQSYVVAAIPGPRPGWATALNYSVQSTTSLLRSPPNPPLLTGLGQVLEFFLRLAGPGLLALAVLALRARVKR